MKIRFMEMGLIADIQVLSKILGSKNLLIIKYAD
jgi:hypothetical protein